MGGRGEGGLLGGWWWVFVRELELVVLVLGVARLGFAAMGQWSG